MTKRLPGQGGGTHTHGRPCRVPPGYPRLDRNCEHAKLGAKVECDMNGCRVPVGRVCEGCGGVAT